MTATGGEVVRQHSLRPQPRPGRQHVERLLRAPARQAQPAQRDEGVAPPVAEPGTPRDDAVPGPALDQILLRRAIERPAQAGAARPLVLARRLQRLAWRRAR